jgi:dGTPase
LSKIEFQDLCDFEGNANGFKILTQSRPGREGGLRLSYATLGAFVKYPKGSLPVKPTSGVADKKYGFFQNEKNIYDEIATELDLKNGNGIYLRHPLTFLVEAADDICYTIIDFEDGINLGLIEEDYALEYLINLVRNTINTKKYNSLNNTPDRVSYLRALSINTLINDAVKIFLDNEDEILKGGFQTSLLKRSEYSAQISDILKISIEKIYQSKEVIEKEVAGYNIINKLLDTFICSVNSSFAGTNTSYDDLILKLLPSTINLNQNSLYSRLLEVCHFVASLSDRKALNVYNKITGVEYQ